MSNLSMGQILLLLLPIILIELALVLVAIRDLRRIDRHVRGGNKPVWAVVIVVSPLLGFVLYFLVGREDA